MSDTSLDAPYKQKRQVFDHFKKPEQETPEARIAKLEAQVAKLAAIIANGTLFQSDVVDITGNMEKGFRVKFSKQTTVTACVSAGGSFTQQDIKIPLGN